MGLQLGGLAEQREELSRFATFRRHLIHHAAGRADDEVLHPLAQQRDLAST